VKRILTMIVSAAIGCALLPANQASSATTLSASDCAKAFYPSLTYALCESQNVAVTGQNVLGHKDLAAGVLRETVEYQQDRAQAIASDRERQPNPNACSAAVICTIDPRMEDWTERGGIVEPVLYTSRSGATMSGHVWATEAGPAKRPGAVFINGSIVGYEEAYWFIAQSLAKAGFVVMTFDAQGEGNSDQFGATPDQLEDAFAGIPFLGPLGPTEVTGDFLGGNGLPFYDGGQDALDFFLSTPTNPFVPRESRSSGTSHAAKQDRRAEAGLNAAYNPLWQKLDKSRIGLSGHSYGAQAASWLTQQDPRVDAGVALDTLCVPVSPSPDEFDSLTALSRDFNWAPYATYGFNRDCFGAPNGPAPALTKPMLGITGDYLLLPTPYAVRPHPLGKSRASLVYSDRGVDTGQITVRGGTHLTMVDETQVVPASLRGIDMTAWYTTAWFEKYVAGDPAGEKMLLSDRWRSDPASGLIDPRGDANDFSWHFRSRLDIDLAGSGRFRCEDLRSSCAGMVSKTEDGWPGEYSFVAATR
jgi:dienelactone hydrolase